MQYVGSLLDKQLGSWVERRLGLCAIQWPFVFNCLQIRPLEIWTMLVHSNACSELTNIQMEQLTCLFLCMKFLIFPPCFYVLDQKSWVIILWNAGGYGCLEEAEGSGKMSVFANSCNEHRFLPLVPAEQCLLSVCALRIRNHPSAPASLAILLYPSNMFSA